MEKLFSVGGDSDVQFLKAVYSVITKRPRGRVARRMIELTLMKKGD